MFMKIIYEDTELFVRAEDIDCVSISRVDPQSTSITFLRINFMDKTNRTIIGENAQKTYDNLSPFLNNVIP